MSAEPLVTINVSKSQTLLFYDHHLTYKGERIAYTDIDGLSYLWERTTHTVYLIPAGSTSQFTIKIQANGKTHKIGFSAGSFLLGKSQSEKEKEEIFAKFYAVIENLIKPFVMVNLLLQVADAQALTVDALTITPQGLYRKRFWRGPEFLPWGRYYNSDVEAGALHVYRQDERKTYAEYFTCPMGNLNAVMVPEVLNFLFQVDGILDDATKNELRRKKGELTSAASIHTDGEHASGYCWSCSAPIETGQRFCTRCGSKLI